MSDTVSPAVTSKIKKDLEEGILNFTVNFGQILQKASEPERNILFSPLNLYTALLLVHLGAEGETRDEISRVMGLPTDNTLVQHIHDYLSDLVKNIQNSDNATVEIAAGIFVQKEFDLKEAYVQKAKELYQSEVANLDFQNDGKTAVDTINTWISDKTKGRIANLFKEEFSKLTVLILASSLYFSANWAHKFKEHQTHVEKFKLATRQIEVRMMNNKKTVPYINNSSLKYEAISLPYEGHHFSMYFVLPYVGETLENLVQQLSPTHLRELIHDTTKQTCEVHYKIPKMKFDWKRDVVRDFNALGMTSVFVGNKANLTNLTSDSRVFVSGVTHATEIEVHETGTVASAVTVLEFSLSCALFEPPHKPIEFFVDRPFILSIYHHPTDSVVFFGLVYEPSKCI